MKKILLALVFFQVFISCKKDNENTEQPYLQFYEAKLSIPPYVSGSADFVIQSNVDWQILVSPGSNWMQLSKKSGHGTDTIHVSVANNIINGQTRTATITAKIKNSSQDLQAQLTVEQKAYTVEQLTQKILPGKLTNYFNALTPDPEGGFLGVGVNNFTGFEGSGFGDAWMVRFNKDGDTLWTRTMGNKTEDDAAKAVIPSGDGGFIVGATSFGLRKPGNPDWWIIKMKNNGDTAWTRLVGTPEDYEYLYSMVPASNGDFIVAGIKNNPVSNVLIRKLDANGNTKWEKYLDEFVEGYSSSMSVTPDGSIYVSISTKSGDYGIAKLNANGEKIWSKIIGSNKPDAPACIQTTPDGGCIIVGNTEGSENGDVTGKNHNSDWDLWVVKLDASGNISWNKLLGGSSAEFYHTNTGIGLTADGGYLFAAASGSQDGDVGAISQTANTWMFKLNNSGQLVWSKTWENPNGNWTNALLMNSDGSWWIAGGLDNIPGYPSDNHSEGLIMKFKEN